MKNKLFISSKIHQLRQIDIENNGFDFTDFSYPYEDENFALLFLSFANLAGITVLNENNHRLN